MRIIELAIEGYRSFKSQTWRPGDLNVVIGPNASGKSNLLRVLEMIGQAAQGRLGRHVQQEGGMDALVWDGQAEAVAVRVKMTPIPPYNDVARDALSYELRLRRLGTLSSYRIERELLANQLQMPLLQRDPQQGAVYSMEDQKLAPHGSKTTTTTPAPEHPVVARSESLPEEEPLMASLGGPFTPNRIVSEFARELASWGIYPAFFTGRDAPVRKAAVARHEKRLQPDGQNLITVLHTLYSDNREFKEDLNTGMRAAFGDDFEELVFPPAADQRIQLRIAWKSLRRAAPSADLSDGTLRFLYLLAILANPDPPGLIAIDEPETGLHPTMLRIVAEYARDAAGRTQVVLTTHSPELLDAFGDDPPTTTVTDWSEGQTMLRVLAGENLDYWLKKYTLGELYRSWELEAMA